MGTRLPAEGLLGEQSHAAFDELLIDDRPVVAVRPDRRTSNTNDDPLRALRVVRRRWRMLLALVVVGALLGWLSAQVAEEADTAPIQVDHYQAAHVLVLDSNVPATQTILGVRNLNVLAKRVTVGEVPTAVATLVGLTRASASNQVRVLIRPESESIDIVAVAETPAVAENLADSYAAELIAYLQAEAVAFSAEAISSAQARLDEAEQNLASLRRDLRRARDSGDEQTVTVLEQDEQQFTSARIFANGALLNARADGIPVVPIETLRAADGSASVIDSSRFDELVKRASEGQNIEILLGSDTESIGNTSTLQAVSSRLPTGVVPRVGLGAVLALFAGLLVLVFLTRIDNRVRSKRQVEDLLDLPVICEMPALPRKQRTTNTTISHDAPRSRFAEQYRVLASTVSYARRSRPSKRGQVVLVTSPGPSEGKTTTVANLGAMLAEAGESVLLINCDFRRPRLHLLTGADYKPMDLNKTNIPEVELISNVVADGDALPTEVIASQRKVIEQASKVYDLIIIDTAPLLATNDAVDLLDLVDDVVLVLRAGKTTIQAAERATEILERRESHVLGVTITDVDAKHSQDYYYYGSYYNDSVVESGPRRFGRGKPETIDADVVALDGERIDAR